MIPRNCLSAVLDRLVSQGGYGVFRGSSHSDWGLRAPHISPEGLAHYAPGAALDRPVTVRAIVVSAWIFVLGATAWAIDRLWRSRK